MTLWLTGLPSAGKTTLALALADVLTGRGADVEILDGDQVRTHLSAGLGFSRGDRETQVTRIGFVAELLARHGVIVLVPVIAPYADARAKVRAHHERHGTRLLEVHLSTPVEVCADRDVKGLYAKAFRGEISSMTGVDDPYEVPENPDLRIDTSAARPGGFRGRTARPARREEPSVTTIDRPRRSGRRSGRRTSRRQPPKRRPPSTSGSPARTCVRWSPKPSTSCARWPANSTSRSSCSPPVRTRCWCCTWPARRFTPRRCRSRCCTSTPGTTSPRCWPSGIGSSPRAACGCRWRRCRTGSTTAGSPSGPTAPAIRCRRCRWSTPSPTQQFDAVIGGARRDEERSRAKERIFSLRDSFGGWDPRRQRPELWGLYNGRHAPGEHVRVFPLSNWTELDVWNYIEAEGIELPEIYYAHEREVFQRQGMWLSPGRLGRPDRAGDACSAGRSVTERSATCPAPAPWNPPRPMSAR